MPPRCLTPTAPSTGPTRCSEKIDRHRIARRLAEQRQLSVVSAPVAELAAGTDAKLACLDRLGEDRQVVSDLGAEAAALLDRSFTAHAVEQVL